MEFLQKLVKWKGKTFNQVVASIQKNDQKAGILSISQLQKPLPLKIYRKEIGKGSRCNSRTSVKIADFETPGNNFVTSTPGCGLVNTLDIHDTSLSAEHGKCDTATACFFSPEYNARKRCRSAGMIPRKFNVNKNNDTYCTSTKQYLVARNRTIKQNEYNYIRKGDTGLIPGPGLAGSNVYSPAGLSHCYRPMISPENDNNVIYYIWIDGTEYTATIPTGFHDIQSLNRAFQMQQYFNKTYLKGKSGYPDVYLLTIGFDNVNHSALLIANVASEQAYSTSNYEPPVGASWNMILESSGGKYPDTTPTLTTLRENGGTYFHIQENDMFGDLIGYFPGHYYNGLNTGQYQGTIYHNYVALHYKPNNSTFGVQGAVDSSALIQRKKYDTITDAANGLRSAYGNAAANAMAYGVTEKPYTIKSAVGDKVIYTPVVGKLTGEVCKKKYIYRL